MTLVRNLVHFQSALRRLGVDTTGVQLRTLVDSLGAIDLEDRGQVKSAAKATLISRASDLPAFEQLFDLFFHRDAVRPRRDIELGHTLRRIAERRRRQARTVVGPPPDGAGDGPVAERDHAALRLGHTDREILRRKDFARLTDAERQIVLDLLRDAVWELPPRRTRRYRGAASGERVDLRATIRRALRHGGEPLELRRRRRVTKPRPLIVLCDISGSMEAYARIFLQFLYCLRGSTERLEAFVFATRLTRLTRQLRERDVDRALADAASRIVDWGGGTRIGEAFRTFHRRWGRRVLGRGAVVAVMSDAWDRGAVEVLERQTRRLAGGCHRLLWLNPLLSSDGYQPVASGIRTVLPYVDRMLPVHNLESLEQLAEVFREL